MRPAWRDLPDGNARGVFGDDDWLGCLNLLTPARTAAAAALVRSGRVFNMNASVMDYNNPNFYSAHAREVPSIPASWQRGAPTHTVLKLLDDVPNYDDRLDGYYPQSGTQWDHFLHCGDFQTLGFYNGHSDMGPGVALWAERGIAGRGVLLDVARWAAAAGRPMDWRSRLEITAEDLERCAASQGVNVTDGTIVLLRVGWQEGYERLTEQERIELPELKPGAPGLRSCREVAERLWDWGVAAIASDNPSLEAWPFEPVDDQLLHEHLLGRLGIPIGEFWLLDALAEACAAERRYEFLLTSAPINLPGGVGSPANALAIM